MAPIVNAGCAGRASHRDRSGIRAIFQDERKHDRQQDKEQKPSFHGSSVTPAPVKSIPDQASDRSERFVGERRMSEARRSGREGGRGDDLDRVRFDQSSTQTLMVRMR